MCDDVESGESYQQSTDYIILFVRHNCCWKTYNFIVLDSSVAGHSELSISSMRKTMNGLFLLTCLFPTNSAWAPKAIITNGSRRLSSDQFITSLQSSMNDSNVLGGVSSFERWFQGVDGASWKEGVSHEDFGNLRGLTYDSANGCSDVMTIPKSIVLDSDFSQPDWDAQLALKLWAECKKGQSSLISGYVDLLTKSKWKAADLPSIPPSTAPDALRHWNEDQLLLLKGNPAGEKLLGLMDTQANIWKSKFANLNSDMTWEQFQWGKISFGADYRF